jgi:hypothetical protein
MTLFYFHGLDTLFVSLAFFLILFIAIFGVPAILLYKYFDNSNEYNNDLSIYQSD